MSPAHLGRNILVGSVGSHLDHQFADSHLIASEHTTHNKNQTMVLKLGWFLAVHTNKPSVSLRQTDNHANSSMFGGSAVPFLKSSYNLWWHSIWRDFDSCVLNVSAATLIKKKTNCSSYIRKFRWDQLESHTLIILYMPLQPISLYLIFENFIIFFISVRWMTLINKMTMLIHSVDCIYTDI